MRKPTKTSLGMCGPVTLEQSFPFVAYVFGGGPDSPLICLTAHLDDHRWLLEEKNLRRLLSLTLQTAKQRYKDWLQLPCLLAHVQPGGKQIAFNVYEGSESEPEKIAKAALRTRTRVLVREVDGRRYLVTQYAPPPGQTLCRYEIVLEDDGASLGSVYLNWDDFDRIDKAIRVGFAGQAEVASLDFGMYMLETDQSGDPVEAFHSFYHAARQSDASQSSLVIAMGRELGVRLLGFCMWDYADWVAGTVCKLSESGDPPNDHIEALRVKGVACSRLGSFDHTVQCFGSALALLPRLHDRALESRLHMSYGLALMDLLSHWETLDRAERQRANAVLRQRLDLAEREVRAARDILAAAGDERAQRNLRFVDLELLRIRDLRGEHAGTRSELEALECKADYPEPSALTAKDIDQIKYEATRLHYCLAATQKAAEEEGDRAWVRYLAEDVPRAVERVNRLPTQRPIADRLCYLMVLAGQCVVNTALDLDQELAPAREDSQGQPASRRPTRALDSEDRSWILKSLDAARQNLEQGLKLQRSLNAGNLASARPGLDYGGLAVIDIAGILQSAQLLLAAFDGQADLSWKAFEIADGVKGRFFKRDLAVSGARIPQEALPFVADELTELRDALLAGTADHRVVMAEYEWATRHNLSAEQAKTYREDASFEEEMDHEKVTAFLEGCETPTAFLSLYANPRETVAYVVTSKQLFPKVERLQVDARSLESRARSLNLGIAGGPESGPIDALEPWKRDEYFRPFQELCDLLKPMMPHFAGASRIVISPHAQWHALPLHALLLPLFWGGRRKIGISYVPSLRAMQLLQKRQKRTAAFVREPIALATVPACEDKNLENQFQREHNLFAQLFRRTHRTVLPAYGVVATREHVLEDMLKAGLYHFLAHGLDAGAANAMKSGLLVANDQGLPSRADSATARSYHLLTAELAVANGTTASHATLQACSLGRAHLAPGDEIWGMTRALLAGGADTVLAPMWDVDLEASSRLLRRFYLHWLVHQMPCWLALTTAQREMATGRIAAFRHFFHWGAFQLVGC